MEPAGRPCDIDNHAHGVPEAFPACICRTSPSPRPRAEPAPDARGLCHLHVFGPDAFVLGNDPPFSVHEPCPLVRLDDAGPEARATKALAYANARRFLGRRPAFPGRTRS